MSSTVTTNNSITGHIESLDIHTDSSLFPAATAAAGSSMSTLSLEQDCNDPSNVVRARSGKLDLSELRANVSGVLPGSNPEAFGLIAPDDLTTLPQAKLSKFEAYKADRSIAERLVSSLANDESVWKPEPNSTVPWSREAEEHVNECLAYCHVTSGFIAGVLSSIRTAKEEIVREGVSEVTERGIAAGFLILSFFSSKALKEVQPTVDFQRTCAEGCKYSKAVVSAAARYTTRELGYQAA